MNYPYTTTEQKAASAQRTGLQVAVRQHDDMSGGQAKGLAGVVRHSFHNIKTMRRGYLEYGFASSTGAAY